MPCSFDPGKDARRRRLITPAASYSDRLRLVSLSTVQAAQALRFLTLFFFAAAFSEGGVTSISSIEPPAPSTACRAPAEALATRKASFADRLPLPSRRTP